MSAQVSVTLSSALSTRVRQYAQQKQEEIVDVVEQLLNEALPEPLTVPDWIDLSEPDEDVDTEMQAYLAMHPWLKENYSGQYVAIYHGKLVDVDEDFDALFDRIDHAYPEQFVWISKVGDEPIETFTVRSPKFTLA